MTSVRPRSILLGASLRVAASHLRSLDTMPLYRLQRPRIPTSTVCPPAAIRRYVARVRNKGGQVDMPSPTSGAAMRNVAKIRQLLYALNPATIVFPPMREIFAQGPKAGMRFLWQLLRFWGSGLISHLMFRGGSATRIFPYPQFAYQTGRAQAADVARDLHARMNSALAEGDTKKLSEVCAGYLVRQFENLITHRQANAATPGFKYSRDNVTNRSVQMWEVLSYHGKPKIISTTTHSMPPVPELPPTFSLPLLTQIVVRIVSTQRLARWRPRSSTALTQKYPPRAPESTGSTAADAEAAGWEMLPGTEKTQHLTEYVVLQRQIDRDTYKPINGWRIWGTIKPTTWDQLKSLLDVMSADKARLKRELESKIKKATNAQTTGVSK